MKKTEVNRVSHVIDRALSDRLLAWEPPTEEPAELALARQAMARGRLAEAERHLKRALDTAPDCGEVRTVLGHLHERLGEHHAAYRCYRLALTLNPRDSAAAEGLRRYCHRFGYDSGNRAINPAAASPG